MFIAILHNVIQFHDPPASCPPGVFLDDNASHSGDRVKEKELDVKPKPL